MRNPIIRYVRDFSGKLIGCVAAIEDDNDMGYAVGWSQCNPKDQFIKKVARETALYRAKHGCNSNPSIYNDPIFGKENWVDMYIYMMHLLAEEKFLGRVVNLTMKAPVV